MILLVNEGGECGCIADLTFVVLGERVGVYNIKATDAQEFLAFNKILPLALEDPYIGLLIPSEIAHVRKHVGMGLDNDMKRWRRRECLEESVDLYAASELRVGRSQAGLTMPSPKPILRTLSPPLRFSWSSHKRVTVSCTSHWRA